MGSALFDTPKKKGRVGHEAPSRQAIAAKILGDLQSTSFQRQFNGIGKILQEKLTIQEAKSFGLAKTWSQMFKDAQLAAPLKELMKKVQIVWTVQGREMEQKNVEKSTAEATSEEHRSEPEQGHAACDAHLQRFRQDKKKHKEHRRK